MRFWCRHPSTNQKPLLSEESCIAVQEVDTFEDQSTGRKGPAVSMLDLYSLQRQQATSLSLIRPKLDVLRGILHTIVVVTYSRDLVGNHNTSPLR